MFEDKHQSNPDIPVDKQIKLECLRLVKEFGPEHDRSNPLPIAQEYYDWVNQNSQRQSKRTAKSKV